jgi:hypothetical protein
MTHDNLRVAPNFHGFNSQFESQSEVCYDSLVFCFIVGGPEFLVLMNLSTLSPPE